MIKELSARVVAVFRRSVDDADFAQELEAHIEMLAEDNISRGMPPGQLMASTMPANHRAAA